MKQELGQNRVRVFEPDSWLFCVYFVALNAWDLRVSICHAEGGEVGKSWHFIRGMGDDCTMFSQKTVSFL